VASSVAGVIEPALQAAETARLAGRPTDLRSLSARLHATVSLSRRLLRPSGSARRCIPPEQVIGTAGGTSYGYDKNGRPVLTKEPKLLLNDDNAGKPEGIHLMTGRRPYAAFGNSTGDRQMREYTKAGDGMRLVMLVLHDDRKRE
jgi:hypothetical protein